MTRRARLPTAVDEAGRLSRLASQVVAARTLDLFADRYVHHRKQRRLALERGDGVVLDAAARARAGNVFLFEVRP